MSLLVGVAQQRRLSVNSLHGGEIGVRGIGDLDQDGQEREPDRCV